MREPEIITGAREARSDRAKQVAEEAAKRGPGPSLIRPGFKTFQFVASRYRLLLTAPPPVPMADGRLIQKDPPITVLAEDGLFRVSTDPSHPQAERNAKTLQLIMEHESYGKDFWDLEVKLEQGRQAASDRAVERVLADLGDPSVRERVVAALAATEDEEFEAPVAAKPKAKSSS